MTTIVQPTQHVPTLQHYPPEYKGDTLNEAFAVELHDETEKQCHSWQRTPPPQHARHTPLARTRMLTNQLGYVRLGEEENSREYDAS